MTVLNLNVSQRAAIALAVVLLGIACWAAFVPPHAHGTSCGTWMAPAFDREQVRQDVESMADIYNQSNALGDSDLAGQAANVAQSEAIIWHDCDSSLGTRKTLTWIFLVGGLVVPLGILFVADGAYRREPEVD